MKKECNNKVYNIKSSLLIKYFYIVFLAIFFTTGLLISYTLTFAQESQNSSISELANLYAQKKYIKAYKLAETLLKKYPDNLQIYEYLCMSLYRIGYYNKALNYVNQALGISPNSIVFLKIKGRIYFNLNRFKESEKVLEKVLKLNPQDPWAYYYYGKALFHQGKYYLAVVAFETALYFDSTIKYYYYYYAYSLYKIGRKKKALEIIAEGKKKFNYKALYELEKIIKNNL